ncbi:hypothetical protein MNB_SV-15-1595 [hydrothermal vent metagenome]|uniref:Prepilin-type N-terminal cleavage/methylation domain-containing protein n=1 Tax=hydrothermal vent metagenome TaxID=652676 RepID=A0A1W1EK19_9ZZZZ
MKKESKAFTLLEVLVSITLLGFVMAVLYKSIDMVRYSNKHLYSYLQKSTTLIKGINTIYLDILKSDGNLTITQNEFSRLCINNTRNSLYNLPSAKVCYLILKDKNRLLRVEGNSYKLPKTSDDRVEIDEIMQNLTLFNIQRNKDKVLVMIDSKSSQPISFMLQGIIKPKPTKKRKKNMKKKGTKIPTKKLPSKKNLENDDKKGLF